MSAARGTQEGACQSGVWIRAEGYNPYPGECEETVVMSPLRPNVV